MRYAIHVFALIGLLAVATPTYAGPAADDGERVYSTVCQGCHMPHGEGAVGAGFYPKLAGDPALASWQFVAITVLEGRHGMPPFATLPGLPPPTDGMSVSLSDVEIAAVVNYVRTHFSNAYKDRATPAAVTALPHFGSRGGSRAG